MPVTLLLRRDAARYGRDTLRLPLPCRATVALRYGAMRDVMREARALMLCERAPSPRMRFVAARSVRAACARSRVRREWREVMRSLPTDC